MNFYHHKERLVAVGEDDDDYVAEYGGRVEVFEIADNEQLIGCRLDEYGNETVSYQFTGVTWFKMKVARFHEPQMKVQDDIKEKNDQQKEAKP